MPSERASMPRAACRVTTTLLRSEAIRDFRSCWRPFDPVAREYGWRSRVGAVRRRRGVPTFTLTINGRPRRVAADPETPLLWVLRDLLRMTGTKYGCGV